MTWYMILLIVILAVLVVWVIIDIVVTLLTYNAMKVKAKQSQLAYEKLKKRPRDCYRFRSLLFDSP